MNSPDQDLPQPLSRPPMSGASIVTQCCIVGGAPAGTMLGFLLARAGVSLAVLQKHADFLRQAEATELIEGDGRILGVRAKTPQGELSVRADLVLGCDGAATPTSSRHC